VCKFELFYHEVWNYLPNFSQLPFGLRSEFVERERSGFVRIKEDVRICEIVWIEG